MTFNEFINMMEFSPIYAAKCILYHPDSRPAKVAGRLGYSPDKEEKTRLVYLVSGKKKYDDLFKGDL